MAWVSALWLHCGETVFSARCGGGKEVLEKAKGFFVSLFAFIGPCTTLSEETDGVESLFIAVGGECSGVDEDWCEDRLSFGAEAERIKQTFLVSSDLGAREGGGAAGVCAVESVKERETGKRFNTAH